MNASIAADWVKALRSGDYKQTKGALRGIDGEGQSSFCCLGVLCNLHAIAHPEIAAVERKPYEYMGMGGTLPTDVINWAGMADGDEFQGVLPGQKKIRNIGFTDLNDNENRKFSTIANIIEANVERI